MRTHSRGNLDPDSARYRSPENVALAASNVLYSVYAHIPADTIRIYCAVVAWWLKHHPCAPWGTIERKPLTNHLINHWMRYTAEELRSLALKADQTAWETARLQLIEWIEHDQRTRDALPPGPAA